MKTENQIEIALDKIIEALQEVERLQKKKSIRKNFKEDAQECRECIVGALLIIEDIKSDFYES
jgi:hypothetical protein